MDIIKELETLLSGLRGLKDNLVDNMDDCDSGLHFDKGAEWENQSKTVRLSALFDRLTNAYNDFDRRIDEVREVESRLLDLIESVEYDETRNQAVEKTNA